MMFHKKVILRPLYSRKMYRLIDIGLDNLEQILTQSSSVSPHVWEKREIKDTLKNYVELYLEDLKNNLYDEKNGALRQRSTNPQKLELDVYKHAHYFEALEKRAHNKPHFDASLQYQFMLVNLRDSMSAEGFDGLHSEDHKDAKEALGLMKKELEPLATEDAKINPRYRPEYIGDDPGEGKASKK